MRDPFHADLQYYAVVWGDNQRWTGVKVESAHEAVLKCFGIRLTSDDIKVYPLGTRKAEAIRKLKNLSVLREVHES